MPVQMWHHIAQAGEIDLVGLQLVTQDFFHGPDGVHQCRAFLKGKLGHFRMVLIEDDAAKARIAGLIHQYHAVEGGLPQQLAAVAVAQGAGGSSHDGNKADPYWFNTLRLLCADMESGAKVRPC
ncbi:hypothetical protein GCM10027296_39750 [Chitinimonas naiadis]